MPLEPEISKDELLELVREGRPTLAQLGEKLGVSRQRVHQLLQRYGIPSPHKRGRPRVRPERKRLIPLTSIVKLTCGNELCQREFILTERQFRQRTRRRKPHTPFFCSRVCFWSWVGQHRWDKKEDFGECANAK